MNEDEVGERRWLTNCCRRKGAAPTPAVRSGPCEERLYCLRSRLCGPMRRCLRKASGEREYVGLCAVST